MDESPISIRVQNLSKRYSNRSDAAAALSDVSFDVPLGQICCLLGPNGSGKTTLMKILAGLLEPTSGSVSIHGFDLAKNPRAVKSNIGWMPAEERSGFYGRLTGRQNLDFFAALQGLESAALDRPVGNLALQIGIGEEIDKMMLKVSSGAKQKIALARCLLHNPPVLLLDEPTRNLDPHTALRFRRLVMNHLTRLQKKTVILSTHQLEEARKMADVIVILEKGRLIKSITSRELDKELNNSSFEDYYMKLVDGNGS